MPAMVTFARRNFLKPSIGPILDFIARWSCSIILFRYFDDRSLVLSKASFSSDNSRTASMGCGIAIKRNDTRRTLLRPQRLPEEELGSRYIVTRAQPEINGPALPVHGSVKINPDAADLDIGLINAPGMA